MFIRRRICGMALLCMGIGPILVLAFGVFAYIVAVLLIASGFWLLFM